MKCLLQCRRLFGDAWDLSLVVVSDAEPATHNVPGPLRYLCIADKFLVCV